MKTFKICALIFCASMFQAILAQDDQPQMLAIHQDDVKFSKIMDYEKISKEMVESFKANDVKGAQWTTAALSDGRYLHVTPIENMAAMDENPLGDASEKLGKEKLSAMLNDMDKCYDSHSDFVVYHMPDLSYHPEGAISMEGKNSREWHFLYYTPSNRQTILDKIKDVKKLFVDKGSKAPFDVYASGFGNPENYLVVMLSGEDKMDIAKIGKENDTVLGEERRAVFMDMLKQVKRYEYAEGEIRPDLSYSPKE